MGGETIGQETYLKEAFLLCRLEKLQGWGESGGGLKNGEYFQKVTPNMSNVFFQLQTVNKICFTQVLKHLV